MSHPLDHPHPLVHDFQHRTGKILKEREGAVLAELVDKALEEARQLEQSHQRFVAYQNSPGVKHD